MADITQIATYLAQGLKQARVCSLTGVSPSTLSELIKTQKFQEVYEPLRLEHSKTRIDDQYTKLEEGVLNQLQENVTLFDVQDLTRILDSVNRYRATRNPINPGITNTGIVQLTKQIILQLPPTAKNELTLNERGEVIAFGGKSLTPLPSTEVTKVFEQLNNQPQVTEFLDLINQVEYVNGPADQGPTTTTGTSS